MAPTGPITSWQILLEIRAASSRSVGWARWVIWRPSVPAWYEARPAAFEEAQRHAGQQNRLRTSAALIHASRRGCQGRLPAGAARGRTYCFFVTTAVSAAGPRRAAQVS